jgi:uncharacterized protein (DUF1499 family)
METISKPISIKYVEGLVDNIMNPDYKKLIAVIKSMSRITHVEATRRYIDLFYKKNGTKMVDMIEYYFRVKKKKIKN